MRIQPPPAVVWITETLEKAGFDTWAVGGAVRDALLGTPSSDWDLATRAAPKEMQRIFKRTVPVGVEHGTVGVLARDGTMYEVTTFRKDVETDGRHAVVAFADRIEDDLSRRDFTINAIAWHPLREELLDPWGGAADLKAGLVRTVGDPADRFEEDYLRILRALRFAGRFGFQIDPPTWTALTDRVQELHGLSVERVREEIWKILEGTDPTEALDLYEQSGALEVVAPEVVARDRPLAMALSEVAAIPQSRPLLRWVAWIREGGGRTSLEGVSGSTPSDERIARATAAAVGLMTRLRFSNAQTDRAARLIAAGPVLPSFATSQEECRRFLAAAGVDLLSDLIRLAGSRIEGDLARRELAASARVLRGVAASGVPLEVGALAIGGRDLIGRGHRPGPYFGEVLDHLLDQVLADPSLNSPEVLTGIAEAWIAERER